MKTIISLLLFFSFQALAVECSLYEGKVPSSWLLTKMDNSALAGGHYAGPAAHIFSEGSPKLKDSVLKIFGDDWIVIQKNAGSELKSLDRGDLFKIVALDEHLEAVSFNLAHAADKRSSLYIQRWNMSIECKH